MASTPYSASTSIPKAILAAAARSNLTFLDTTNISNVLYVYSINKKIVDWSRIFFNDLDFTFAVEIIFRTFIMFMLILVILRLSGKRGVRQLSVFEVAIIISMGSAAGDPMFAKDIAIIPALLVFITIIILYRLITWLTAKKEGIEKLVEGIPQYIVEDGVLEIEGVPKDSLAKDEFFSELRQYSIEHLGQVKIAILETNGNMSVYYYKDEDVRPGLPIVPKVYNLRTRTIPHPGSYACTFCGQVQELSVGLHTCTRCQKDEWVLALSTKRIT